MYADSQIKSDISHFYTEYSLNELSAEEIRFIRASIEIHFNTVNKAKAMLLIDDRDSTMLDDKLTLAKNLMEGMDRII